MNETKLLNDGIAALENKIVTVRELCEKQVLLFYRDELRRLRPCPENEQFQRPGKGIGGRGDKMVFQKLVCRDEADRPIKENGSRHYFQPRQPRDEADRPIKENGSLKTKICAFENIETYVDFIVNGKTPQRKPLAFYNGMTMEEYINIQISTNIYGSRSY